jgi:hypothetical protein
MKKNKVTQIQRIARLERLITEMYLKVEALKVIIQKIENNEDKTTG